MPIMVTMSSPYIVVVQLYIGHTTWMIQSLLLVAAVTLTQTNRGQLNKKDDGRKGIHRSYR